MKRREFATTAYISHMLFILEQYDNYFQPTIYPP